MDGPIFSAHGLAQFFGDLELRAREFSQDPQRTSEEALRAQGAANVYKGLRIQFEQLAMATSFRKTG